jgi:hypothetical protein
VFDVFRKILEKGGGMIIGKVTKNDEIIKKI